MAKETKSQTTETQKPTAMDRVAQNLRAKMEEHRPTEWGGLRWDQLGFDQDFYRACVKSIVADADAIKQLMSERGTPIEEPPASQRKGAV
jgi:hypothetical protein